VAAAIANRQQTSPIIVPSVPITESVVSDTSGLGLKRSISTRSTNETTPSSGSDSGPRKRGRPSRNSLVGNDEAATPKAPTPKAPTPKVPPQKVPTPKAPTPKIPPQKVPTPKALTPKAPTPKIPPQKIPTPKVPTPNPSSPIEIEGLCYRRSLFSSLVIY
jgi:hypothetical protein